MEKVLENVVAMMKQHPDGIPIKKFAVFYNKKYHRNLTLSSLGFDNMVSLVAFLDRDLIMDGELVFHKDHHLESQTRSRPATPQKVESLTTSTTTPRVDDASLCVPPSQAASQIQKNQSPLIPTSALLTNPWLVPNHTLLNVSKPAEKLTQEKLLQRVEEVMKKDPLSPPSMDQLQTSYVQHFGEQFPLLQYMSLYDSCEVLRSAQDVKRESEKECQQESAVPSMLSDSDFPALGAAESSKKEKKIKRRVQPQREGGAPVFTKSYHTQLREVHGANLREVKSMEDEPQLTEARRKIKLDVDTVNSLMEDVIRDIASEGELVTKEKVTSRICKQLQIHSLEAVGISSHMTPALKNLRYTMREINMFIECAEAVTSICTLYELGQSLAGLKDKKQYEELNLGPLCKLPLVHRMFKIDSNTKDDDIFQIGTIDILKQLRAFKRQQGVVRVDLAEFMKHLADNYNCDSPYELGIRICSLGLPIATLSKVSRFEHNIMDQAREVIGKELEEEIHEQLRKLKKNVLEPLRGAGNFSSTGSFDLRRKYATMSAAEVVLEVLSNAEELFTRNTAVHVKGFLLLMSNNRLAKSLFQLAICGGSLSAPQDLVPKGKPSKAKGPTKTEDKPLTSLPSEAQVKQYLKESLSSQKSVFSLANMAALERKFTKHFQAKDFLSLEQGNFLEFLVKHNQILQDTLGSFVFVGGGIMEFSGSGFRPTRQDVFDVINQCGDITSTAPTELSAIESVLRSHYRIRDIRELGYGTLHKLVERVQDQRKLAGGGLNKVHYESALFAKHCNSSPEGGFETGGCLGEISKAQAMASLLSCPLLEDLNEWSQWELVFKPGHGPLKEFIERNAAQTGLAALEVRPGLLLRITTHTGDKHFSNAAMTLDHVGTAGHLVSMVVADGIANTPTALLANHMQRYLASAVAEDLSETDEDVSSYGRVTKFLLACLTRIPIRTCQALLQQVFLEPFSAVMGQTKSKQVLITVAQSDPKNVNCLHRLGIVLGITDWVKDYQQKLKPPQSQNGNTHTPPEEQSKTNLRDSESNSMAALNTIEFEILEDSFTESGFISSHLNQSLQQDHDELEVDEDDDEEALYELRVESLANGETSDISIEAEGGHGEEQLELSVYEKDAASSRSEIEVDPKRAIIEDIRKSEFGIGVELNAEGQKLMQVHQDRLGRSLDRLSTELYSKDTHFVLELIQNADDNNYPSDPRVVPALAFVVTRDCITVLNNETGFQERNIRAICDVGRSTKGKHKSGYIGQKGIGFKSVFKVTNCPEIHSNGFHLRFDKTCGPMGYILPHWAEDERPLDTELKDINRHSWTTKVCLPLRSESIQTRNLFHDIHPSLLLFLHRLRFLAIYNQNEKRLVTMTRNNLSHNILEVKHTDGTVRWLVVKTTLQPKKIRDDVESTELALAFQLECSSTGSDVICQPQKQPLFAYLPLRSFGFRFIVQGDFDIPSSREDVDRDSSWNQWLRSEIPHLFLQAMDEFSDHPKFNRLNALCQFLLFIPLPDEVLDFFKPVASQIIQLLKGKAFLPTLSSDGRVVYKLPSQVAICQDAVIRNVIGEDELQRHLSLSYLHPTLSKAPPNTLLTHLGVQYLQGSDVSTVTTAMTKELMRVDGLQSDASLRQLARLLVCNFRALEHGYGEPDSIRQTLRDLPIIPLADGRVVVLSEEEVFFPMEEIKETKTRQKKKDQPQTGPLSALYKDVTVVHPTLLCCMEPLENQQVRELLRRIGVHEMEPRNLLDQHIYPTIKSNKWKSKPESVVVSYLVFIKRHSSSIREYTGTAVPVLTCRGLLSPANERVHFSEEYGNINLSKKLPGCDWILLSPCYVQTDGDVEGWRELFNNLGVRDGLIIRKERQTLSPKELSTGPWSKESVTWYLNPGQGCVIDDYPCEEFHALATAQLHGSILLNQRMALLELLATNWNTGHCYSQYLTAQVVDRDGREFKSTTSSFYHLLCFLEWVPAYRPLEDEQQDRKFLRPNSVYLSSPEITSLLGTHVFYLDMDTSEFSRALGLKQSVTVDVLIRYLKKWCVSSEADNQENGPPEDELEGANFTSTVQHIHNVYTYLHMNCPQSSLKELFQHTPAVFVELKRRNGDLCSGRFHHLKEVCWSDPTAMFHRYKQLTNGKDSPFKEPRVLAPFYKPLENMREFFIKLLNVDTSPNMNQYIGLLELICSSSSVPTPETLQDVSVLYARLAQKCKVPVPGDQEYVSELKLNHGYCSTLKGMMSDLRVFPTKDSSWVSLRRKPLIPDSKEFEKVFKHHKIVCLLNLPPAEKKAMHTTQNIAEKAHTVPYFDEQDRSLFLEICGIRKLSQCVKTEAQTEDFRPCPPVQGMVRPLVPYIQRFLYHHDELCEIYSELIDNNIGEKFGKLQFTQVGKLYIRYQLDVGDDELVEVQDVNCLLKDNKEFYIQKDHLLSKLEICRELVKLFCKETSHRKELMSFLSGLIISLNDPESLKRFLVKEDIRELPSEEEVWEIPEPPKPDITQERVLSRYYSSRCSPVETPQFAKNDGEQTLICWPPQSSLLKTGTSSTARADGGAVEDIMKMWPPPASPKDREAEVDMVHRRSSQSPSISFSPNLPLGSSRPTNQTNPAAAMPTPAECRKSQMAKSDREESLAASIPPPASPAGATNKKQAPNILVVPDAVVLSSPFQGTAANMENRPPLNLDFPLWNTQYKLEDMDLTCQKPSTVVFSDDVMDKTAIGKWGEQLVNNCFCHLRDSDKPGRPVHVLWCNQTGESGHPFDFKLTFGAEGGERVVYVEVKSTVKKEKSFIHLSANELDFALKKKECYHILRVYSAGDNQNVRLQRIRNLAQRLHTKDLAIYLFI